MQQPLGLGFPALNAYRPVITAGVGSCPFRSIAGGSRMSWGRAWGLFQARRALRWPKTGCRIRGQQQQKAGRGQVTSHYHYYRCPIAISGCPATPPPPAHHHETSSVPSRVQLVKGKGGPRRTRAGCTPSCGPAFLLPTGCSLAHGVPLQLIWLAPASGPSTPNGE